MPRNRTNYNRISESKNEKSVESPKVFMKVKEKDNPVRIRSGPGTSYSHIGGRYLGKGVFEISEVVHGPGSKSGWGRLADRDEWIALDFVEKIV